eukprot:SM000065S20213  [mRNA]  locus=s65:351795:354263:- [translate_table: standard]
MAHNAAAAVDGGGGGGGGLVRLGCPQLPLEPVVDASEESGGGGGNVGAGDAADPLSQRPNRFVAQAAPHLALDAAGQHLRVLQAPSALMKAGVTGSVLWDSGVVLAKFLEHAADTGALSLKGASVVELGAGCGLVGCVAALLGARVVLTDVFGQLALLEKNLRENIPELVASGYATARELVWGDEIDADLVSPAPDYVVASDVVFSHEAVGSLVHTLEALSDDGTTIIISGELRDHAVLQIFLDNALAHFDIGRVAETQLHLDFTSYRIAAYVLQLRGALEL